MLSDSLRQRLESLNRQRLPIEAPATDVRRVVTKPQPVFATDFASEPTEVKNELGSHLVYTLPLEQLWPAGPKLVDGRLDYLRSQPLCDEMTRLVAALPDRGVMLDLETCGLSGSALFLAGMLRWVAGKPAIELLFARTYAEEPAVLASLWQRLEDVDVVCTYNGKSFDWPMVIDRSHRHLLHKRLELCEPVHIDMLHHARRKWRDVLPNCKLQTVEQQVCRRPRGPDIPGAQIPAVYDQYVRTGDPADMLRVLHHNALDLVTLLDIAMRVAA